MSRPTPVLVYAILISLLLGMLALTLGWLRNSGNPGQPTGDPLPESLSYVKHAPGNRFVVVMFGSAEAEAKLTGDAKAKNAAARMYPRSGVYPADQPEPHSPLWTLEGYAPDENVFLSADGKCLVRLEGEWWKTKAYPAGKRLPPEVEAQQLAAPAVSFFSEGQLIKQYRLQELITEPELITHSPEHILWPGGAVMNEKDGRFVLFTQDTMRTIFDYRTGSIISQEKVGLNSRFSQKLVMVVVGLMVLMVAGWIYYALIRKGASPTSSITSA